MVEIILAMIAAIITIVLAGLLVKKQERCHSMREDLERRSKEGLETVVEEAQVLIKDETVERSLDYLEKRMKELNDMLGLINAPNPTRENERRRAKSAKPKAKKHFKHD